MAINLPTNRVFRPTGGSTNGGTKTVRAGSTGDWAVDFSDRIANDTALASGTATGAGLTIGAPTISGDKRHVVFAITAGFVADQSFTISVTATADNGDVEEVQCIIQVE